MNKVVPQMGGQTFGTNTRPPPPPPPPPRPVQTLTIDPLTGEAVHMPPNPKQVEADEFYIKRLSDEEQKKNRDDMLAREEDLIYMSPMLEGYALKNKLWCKFVQVKVRK
jgi:hypothetical protein